MADIASEVSELRSVVESIRRGEFKEWDADRLLGLGAEAVKFVLLALAANYTPPRLATSPQLPKVRAGPGLSKVTWSCTFALAAAA